jgi:hypothetical protein
MIITFTYILENMHNYILLCCKIFNAVLLTIVPIVAAATTIFATVSIIYSALATIVGTAIAASFL